MLRRFAVLASVLLLGSCAGINDWIEGKVEYKQASTVPPLEIPPDLTSPTRDNRYVVPETGTSTATLSGYQAERREAKPGAAGPAVLPQPEHMRIERAGTQRWLVVDEKPEKLWPLVRDFWQENGFLIKLEQPEVGVMETEWAESRARIPQGGVRGLLSKAFDTLYSTSERDKYRTRLDRTADGNGTEIYISHRGMVEVYTTRETQNPGSPGATAWQPREPDPELEAEYLRRLMVRLGAQEEKARTLMANAGVPAQQNPQGAQARPSERAQIRKGVDGLEALEVAEPFDRVWRRVGLALDRGGFTVEDRDRQKGIYFVRYADPEVEKDTRGLLTRWFSSDSKVKAQQYRVQITQAGTASQVNVLNKDGAADSSKTAQRILTLLHEQLK
ncbi:MAG TPA: outer membrane protein assembly factor BamC [Burkholderiales bacterium]|nr:outer membrane protein assembly factor BamC [Burkholderiales bacterium]